MGIFKSKQKVNFEDDGAKTPIKFKRGREVSVEAKSRKKKIKRAVIFSFLFLVLFGGGFLGFRAYSSLKNMFADGSGNILNLFGGSQSQLLRGETTGRTNILLIGVGDENHPGSTLSDTLILMSIDARSKNVAMFSIPRDLYVQIPNYGYSKINSAHAYGEQYKIQGGGPALLKQTIEKSFDTTIHYYVRVDFSGLQKVVDSLGGVTVNVENAFCDYTYPVERKGDTRTICFKAGEQSMNGTRALQYARSRHALGPEGSDFARSKRQQILLVAIKEKLLSANTVFNPKKVLDFLSVLGDHLKTDFQAVDFPRLYEISKEVDTSKIISKNFDNSPEGFLVSSSSPQSGYILSPRSGNFKEIQAVIKNIFESVGIKDEAASITLLNGTYSQGLALKVSDGMKNAGYVVVSTGSAENTNYLKSIIIDYTGGEKLQTKKALEKKFGVTAVSAPKEVGQNFDFKVVIGRDYRE